MHKGLIGKEREIFFLRLIFSVRALAHHHAHAVRIQVSAHQHIIFPVVHAYRARFDPVPDIAPAERKLGGLLRRPAQPVAAYGIAAARVFFGRGGEKPLVALFRTVRINAVPAAAVLFITDVIILVYGKNEIFARFFPMDQIFACREKNILISFARSLFFAPFRIIADKRAVLPERGAFPHGARAEIDHHFIRRGDALSAVGIMHAVVAHRHAEPFAARIVRNEIIKIVFIFVKVYPGIPRDIVFALKNHILPLTLFCCVSTDSER